MAQLIRSHNPRFGNPQAPITIIAFIDFECPFCQRAYADFTAITKQYEPVVQVVFKHFPIASIHPHSNAAALAAACAHEQGKFWQYYDRLFTTKQLDTDGLNEAAKTVGLNLTTFTSCVETAKYQSQIDTDLADGASIHVRGTPTYVINQTVLEGTTPRDVWDKKILELLR